jgi:hypothetical protein
MGVCKNEAPLAVNNYARSEAGLLLPSFKSRIKKIPKEILKKGIHAETRKWIGALANLIGGAYINYSRADFAYGLDHSALAIVFMTARFLNLHLKKKAGKQQDENVI